MINSKLLKIKTQTLNLKEQVEAVQIESLTPDQLKQALRMLQERIAELEARYDEIMNKKIDEAVGTTLSKFITNK